MSKPPRRTVIRLCLKTRLGCSRVTSTNCGDNLANLFGGKNWHLREDDPVFTWKSCGQMTFTKEVLCPFLPKGDLGGARAFDPQNETVPEIVVQLQRHHSVFWTPRREDQKDASGATMTPSRWTVFDTISL